MDASQPIIGNSPGTTNDLYNNVVYDLYVAGSQNLDACYNYWGTLSESEISKRIYDKHDNPAVGEVRFQPFATVSGGANQFPDPFVLLAPVDKSKVKSLTPSFSWQKAVDVDSPQSLVYVLQLSLSQTFSTTLLEFAGISGEVFRIPYPLADGTTYYWRVKAVDGQGGDTWSKEIWAFTVDLAASNQSPLTPVIVAPIAGELTANGYLIWSQSKDPDLGDVVSYTVEINNKAEFSNPLISQSGILGDQPIMGYAAALQVLSSGSANAVCLKISSLTESDKLQDDKIYYWRVKAVDNNNAESNFTDAVSQFFFNRANSSPSQVIDGFSPADGLEVRTGNPEISWYPSADPDLSDHSGTLRYIIQLDDDGEFSNNYQYQYETNPGYTTVKISEMLTENMQWSYRIMTKDDEGMLSGFSDVQYFWVNAVDEPPLAFSVLAPSNDYKASNDTVLIHWQEAHDPDPNDRIQYTLEWSNDQQFSDCQRLTVPIPATHLNLIRPDLLDDLFWRLKATDPHDFSIYATNFSQSTFHISWQGLAVHSVAETPQFFSLRQNYPNPFNHETVIEFALPKPCHVTVGIVNINGQEMRMLVSKRLSAGTYSYKWDGRDENNQLLSSGIYLISMQAGDYSTTGKICLIK